MRDKLTNLPHKDKRMKDGNLQQEKKKWIRKLNWPPPAVAHAHSSYIPGPLRSEAKSDQIGDRWISRNRKGKDLIRAEIKKC